MIFKLHQLQDKWVHLLFRIFFGHQKTTTFLVFENTVKGRKQII